MAIRSGYLIVDTVEELSNPFAEGTYIRCIENGKLYQRISGIPTEQTSGDIPSHLHIISDITDLQTALDSKVSVNIANAPATTGSMTVPMINGIIKITPTGNCTFIASGGIAGQICNFVITTSGTVARTLTWSTNFRPQATLSTGTVNAKKFVLSFLFDGVHWIEKSRTTAR